MSDPLSALDVERNFGKVPLAFEPNQGQWQRPSLFGAHGQGFTAAFSAREVTFHLLQGDKTGKGANVRMQWKGAQNGARLNAIDKLPGVSNYFRGNDPSQWKTGVPQYRAIRVDNLYPGIDVVYYGRGRELEYDIEAAPGADPARIQLRVEGAQQLRVDHDGNLVIGTAAGDLVQHKPVVYQMSGTRRIPIEARYRVRNNDTVAMELSGYDQSRKLVIDPVISWGVALGGNDATGGYAVGVDGSGNVYLAGYTRATDFPLVNPYDNTLGCSSSCPFDAFLTKISPDGITVLYSTFLGGSLADQAYALAVDATGNAYLAGSTSSTDFPTKSPYQAGLSGTSDAFLAKFTPSGGLVFSTYLGGSGYDEAQAVAIDSSGSAYVAGWTTSTDFPTVGAIQSTLSGGTDAFVTKVSPDGSTVVFSTYLGGSTHDIASAVTIGPLGTVYVAGTASANFPTKNPIEPCSSALPMAFVAQLAPSGAALVYSTCLGVNTGGSILFGGGAGAYGMDVDASGAVYVVGGAGGPGFPLRNPIQNFGGGFEDAFAAKLTADGSALVYSTFLGGNDVDYAAAIRVDSNGSATITGYTASVDFPTYAAFDPIFQNGDGFVTQLNSAGSAVAFSTFLGGSAPDDARGLALDGAGAIYAVGQTLSSDFPSSGSPYRPYDAAYVVKLAGPTTSVAVTVNSVPSGLSVVADGVTITTPKTFQWAQGATHQLNALSPQATAGPTVNTFVSWSNGGTESQRLTTPANATTYTANYLSQACVYSLVPGSIAVGQASGSYGVSVSAQQGCPWNSSSDVPWITGSFQGSGSGYLYYSVAANPAGGTRTGSITIGNVLYTVTQQYMTPSATYSQDCCGATGLSQTFSFGFTDADGVSDLTVSNVLINNFLDGRNACYLAFDHVGQVLYLVNDAGTSISGMQFDSQGRGSGVLSNSQCAVDGTKTYVSPFSGSTGASLSVGLVFATGFAGDKVIYLAARDKEGKNSGWLPSGTWNIPGTVMYPEVVSSGVSTQGTPYAVSISVTYRDQSNSAKLSPSQILVNDYLDGRHACYLGYDHVNNLLYLVNDAGTGLLPAITPNTSTGSQENSQCIVYAQGTTVTSNGQDYTLRVNLYFLPAFSGRRIVYAASQTTTGGNSGWHATNALNLP